MIKDRCGCRMNEQGLVAMNVDTFLQYPKHGPFHPAIDFPEYPFRRKGLTDRDNHIYSAVREVLRLLGLDQERYGSCEWNPFGGFVRPGDTVLIKPNAVVDHNYDPCESVFACITHGSIIRSVCDYACIALGGKGRIVIADAPMDTTNFAAWRRVVGIDSLEALYREHHGVRVEVHDLRRSMATWDEQGDFKPARQRSTVMGDPAGYTVVDLGDESALCDFRRSDIERLYGADYSTEQTRQHHTGRRHEYYVAQSVLNADVVVSIPKMKTHQKVGVTLNLKGMVGTQGDKNYIPHFRIGSSRDGGDEYPDLGIAQNALNRFRTWSQTEVLGRRTEAWDRVYRCLNRLHRGCQTTLDTLNGLRYKEVPVQVSGGAWFGNDTAWRIALDVTKVVLFADRAGVVHNTPQRRFFSVVDGVVGGEGEGPLAPRARYCGAILCGFNPLAVDSVAARLMGFDPLKLPMIAHGLCDRRLMTWDGSLSDLCIKSNLGDRSGIMSDAESCLFAFAAPVGWRGHCEVGRRVYSPLQKRWNDA